MDITFDYSSNLPSSVTNSVEKISIDFHPDLSSLIVDISKFPHLNELTIENHDSTIDHAKVY